MLSNSDTVKKKFKKFKKFVQKKRKFKISNKIIQFIKEDNDIKTKLIKKLKKEIYRAVMKVMTVKDTDRENKLNNDNDLKNLTFILKNSKGKSEFTKSTVLI